MRMWMVDPKLMCRKHLLGEHVEIHMLVGCLRKDKNIKGYIEKGLIEPRSIYTRHNELAREMVMRGYRHNSSIREIGAKHWARLTARERLLTVDTIKSILELRKRCKECKV